MSQALVIFNFEGKDTKIQCSRGDKMKDICQKYINKIDTSASSLLFLYDGDHLNFQLCFKDQANKIDKERNEMNVLVYKNKNEGLICPKCGEKIYLKTEKLNDIKSSIDNIIDIIKGIKLMIEKIIKMSSEDSVKFQLKNVCLINNNLNENIKNLNKKFEYLLNDINFNNFVVAEINVKDEDVNKNIRILNSYEEFFRTNPGKLKTNDNFKNEDEIKKCEIKINNALIPFNYYYKFKSKGKYDIKYYFKTLLNSTCLIFGNCKLLTKIDLYNFNTKNTTYMTSMFYECSSLKNINLSNFNTNNATDMNSMFFGCSSLKNIDLSTFNTNNATDFGYMFYGCSSLTSINMSNFNTNNIINMGSMFRQYSSLPNIDLSNFDTKKVIDIHH